METRPNTLGNNLCNVHAAGNARLQLGDQYFAGGLVISTFDGMSKKEHAALVEADLKLLIYSCDRRNCQSKP